MKRRDSLHLLAAGGWLGTVPALWAQAVSQPPAEVRAELPNARLQGSGRLRYFGLHIYDARLWVGPDYPRDAPAREDYAAHPLALELEYARSFEGAKIAERTIDEMEQAGKLPPAKAQGWLEFMKATFPDVSAGMRLTGVQRPGESTHFFGNGKPLRELRDAEFARRFFGVWLAPQTTQPAMRLKLLGGGP